MMGPSFIEAGRIRELRDELAELKKKVDFQERVLEMQSSHLADIRAILKDRAKPQVKEITPADAYIKAIKIVADIKSDVFTRNIIDSKTREWVVATLEDVIDALQWRLNRCESCDV